MKSYPFRKISVLVLFLAVAAGCAGGGKGMRSMPSGPTLYERLGGKPAIKAVVGDFLGRVASDNRIANPKVQARLASADLPSLKMHVVNLVCSGAGGPCKYTGRSMKDSHAGLKITSREFDVVVEDLVAALDKFNVPEKEKTELLSLLGPMKKEIVEVP
jgi:hemoglobin